MNATVGRRRHWQILGHAIGFAVGALLALPLGLWWAAPLFPGGAADYRRGVVPWFFGATFGASVGGAAAYGFTTFPEAGRRIVSYALWGALGGSLIGAFVVAAFWVHGGNLLFPVTTAFYCLVMSVRIGLTLGTNAAMRDEADWKAAMYRRLRELDEERAALENAVREKFGSLDEARRAMIHSWDRDRLAEARQKLADATCPDEV